MHDGLSFPKTSQFISHFYSFMHFLGNNKKIKRPFLKVQTLKIAVLAGVEGFEPPDDGVRVRSLTAWRYPNVFSLRFYRNILPINIITFTHFFQLFYTLYLKFFLFSLKIPLKTLDILLNVCYNTIKI